MYKLCSWNSEISLTVKSFNFVSKIFCSFLILVNTFNGFDCELVYTVSNSLILCYTFLYNNETLNTKI